MNKKLIIGILIGFVIAGGLTILAAPVGTVLRSVVPEANNEFYLGTTSPKTYWKNIYTQELTVTNGTATTTLSAGDSLATFAYPFTGITSTLNATTSGLRIASSTVLGSLNIGTLTATSGTSYIQALTVANGLTVTAGSISLPAGSIADAALASIFSRFDYPFTVLSPILNSTSTILSFTNGLASTSVLGWFNTGDINASSSIKTNNFTVTGTLSLPANSVTNAMVSDTLTASDLVAGSSVVANAEIDNDLTISGGVIDNTIIGGTTAVAGTFTNLVSTASTTFSTTARITAQGTMYFGGSVGIGTSTPTFALTLNASSSPLAAECRFVVTGAFTLPLSKCVNSSITAVGNVTLTVDDIRAGVAGSINACQDGTGGRTWTWDNTLIRFMNATSSGLTQTPNRCNLLGFKGTVATNTTPVLFVIPTDAF